MPSALYQPSSFAQPVSLRRRAASFAAAVVANVLLLLMLFTLAPAPTPQKPRDASTFSLLPDREAEVTPEPTKKAKKASGQAAPAKAAAKAPVPAPATPPTEPVPTPPATPLNLIRVPHDVLAATDRAMQAHPSAESGAGAANDTGAGRADGADDGEGTGPHGEKLYNAEWQTEPTNAQLAGYLPTNGPRTGWGMIACRTIEQYRVDDCVELAQSPPGSGFARAVRQAAWQFRVRPPRVGDRRIVGAWVRIRIDYGAEKAN